MVNQHSTGPCSPDSAFFLLSACLGRQADTSLRSRINHGNPVLLRVLGCLLLLTLLLSQAAHAQDNEAQGNQQPALTVDVDRTEINENQTLVLTIRVNSALGTDSPVVSGLDANFTQLGGTTSNIYTSSNGQVRSWTEYRLSLTPKRTGELVIPSFSLAGESTDPITITVSEDEGTAENRDIFVETSVDKQEVYVQEQLILSVKLFYSVSFDQGARLSAPEAEDAVVQQLGSDASYDQTVEGKRYRVTERTFVIFPQRSGSLEIAPISFTASIGLRSTFGRGLPRSSNSRRISISSEPHEIEVKSQPDSFPGDTWLPASELTVEAEWSGDPGDLQVGESLTQNLEITAHGLSSSLLPELDYDSIPGLRFYPEQISREDTADSNGVIGTLRGSIAVVPSAAGEYRLPELRLPWWNTRTDTLEYATVPATTLQVAPNPASRAGAGLPGQGANQAFPDNLPGAQETSASRDRGLSPFWISLSVFLALAWLVTALLFWRHRRFNAQTVPAMPVTGAAGHSVLADELPDTEAAFKALQRACKNENLRDIRQALIAWAQGFYGNRNIRTLDHIKAYSNSPTLAALLFNLEQALYSEHAERADVRCSQLCKEVGELQKRGHRAQEKKRSRFSLPPLYKN